MSHSIPYSAGVDRPAFTLPENACDCHMHLFDNQFPFVSPTALTHPDANVEDYRLLQKRLGLKRCVVVQPSSYGLDHRALLNGLRRLGRDARGVAVVDSSVDKKTLAELNEQGVVGTRFNLVQRGATHDSMLEPVAHLVREYGWHLQLHMSAEVFLAVADRLAALPVPIVIDHLARVNTDPLRSAEVEARLLKLLDHGDTWIKLSGAYIASHDHPCYRDLDGFVQRLLKSHPERAVWGSDWPHVTEAEKPNDADLLNLTERWAPDERVRRRIFVDNPASLYKF
jgi:D-galactarolactone isomerase